MTCLNSNSVFQLALWCIDNLILRNQSPNCYGHILLTLISKIKQTMIQEILDFFTGITKDSWRDAVISSLLIPLVFYLFTKLRTWLLSISPINLVLAEV